MLSFKKESSRVAASQSREPSFRDGLSELPAAAAAAAAPLGWCGCGVERRMEKVAVFFPLTFSPQPFFMGSFPSWRRRRKLDVIIILLLFLLLKLLLSPQRLCFFFILFHPSEKKNRDAENVPPLSAETPFVIFFLVSLPPLFLVNRQESQEICVETQ